MREKAMAKQGMLRIDSDGKVTVLQWSQGSVDEFEIKDFTKDAQREVLRLGPGLYRISIKWRAGYMEVQSVKRVEPKEEIARFRFRRSLMAGPLFRTESPEIRHSRRMQDMTRVRQENTRLLGRVLEILEGWYA